MDTVRLSVTAQTAIEEFSHRLRSRLTLATNEQGEGVISTAIAVLIMAVIGAAMFAAYIKIFNDSSKDVSTKIASITVVAGSTP